MRLATSVEWDMAHRLPAHPSKCKNLHGHRYCLTVTVGGSIQREAASPERGMVIDFAKLKGAVKEVVEPLDHACMLWESDPLLALLREAEPELRWIAVPFMPTAEEMVAWLAESLRRVLTGQLPGITLEQLELHETPTNSVIWCRE